MVIDAALRWAGSRRRRYGGLPVLAAWLCVSGFAGPATSIAAGLQMESVPTHYYDDAGRRRPLVLEAGLAAIPGPAEPAAPAEPAEASAVRRGRASGQPALASGGMQIVPQALPATGSARPSATRAATAPEALPVFREGGAGGRLRVPVGGVLLRFPDGWTDDRVESWLTAAGVMPLRQPPVRGQWRVIAAPPGVAAVALANALTERGEEVVATPVFWRPLAPR